MTGCLLLVFSALAQADAIVLDNGHMRIEVDPALFAIRFVGTPGGPNFVEALHVDPAVRSDDAWADPGGVQTDLIPYPGQDAALRRGPAEVIDQSPMLAVLLGPPSRAAGIRLKKEIQLYPGLPKARFRVTAYASGPRPVDFSLRNTVRVAPPSTLRIPIAQSIPKALSPGGLPDYVIVKSIHYWLAPLPPTSRTENLVLGGQIEEIELQKRSDVWVRRLLTQTEEGELPEGVSFLCLIDDASRSYGAAFQGPRSAIAPDSPSVLEEIWTLKKRGG